MARIVIFRSPHFTKYYAPLFSFATAFRIVFFLSTLFIPFLIAYRSDGFWLEQISTFEQPLLQSTREFYIELVGEKGIYAWSSRVELNSQLSSSFEVPYLRFQEFDSNSDGVLDGLKLIGDVPVSDAISAMRLVVIMSYRIRNDYFGESSLKLPLAIHLASSGGEGCKKVKLTTPVSVHSYWKTGESADSAVKQATDLNFSNILLSDFQDASQNKFMLKQKAFLSVQKELALWIPGLTSFNNPFNFNITLLYKTALIRNASPEFWENMFYGWIQYVPILVLARFVSRQVQTFAFTNRLFDNCIAKSD